MVNELSQAHLARRLGISGAMVSKLHRRGMPLDEAGARAWRKEHLSPFHCKARRIDGNTGLRYGQQPAPKTWTVAELLELAEGIAEIMCDDEGRPHIFAEGMPHLVATVGALARADEAAVRRLVLPLRVAAAVEAFLETS
jgi:hypothetical protein